MYEKCIMIWSVLVAVPFFISLSVVPMVLSLMHLSGQ